MRISDWSSDVCSSDLGDLPVDRLRCGGLDMQQGCVHVYYYNNTLGECQVPIRLAGQGARVGGWVCLSAKVHKQVERAGPGRDAARSEENTSELQSLMRISYDVFCL